MGTISIMSYYLANVGAGRRHFGSLILPISTGGHALLRALLILRPQLMHVIARPGHSPALHYSNSEEVRTHRN